MHFPFYTFLPPRGIFGCPKLLRENTRVKNIFSGLASAKKCGYVPSQVTLKRGERQKLVFWTDQNYDNPPPEELVVAEPDAGDQNGQETIEADEFLAAVNGMMKPSAAEDSTRHILLLLALKSPA